MGFCACVYVRVETSLRMCVFVEVEGVCGCLCVMRPPKPPTGGQAVTAQLIVVSIWAAGKGRSSVHGARKSSRKKTNRNEDTKVPRQVRQKCLEAVTCQRR